MVAMTTVLTGPFGVVQFECECNVGLGTSGSVAVGVAWDCGAGHAVRAGTRTSGAGACLISKRGVRTDGIVMTPPAFDHDLRLLERVEHLTFEQFVTQTRVEALDVSVLPWRARCDIRYRPDSCKNAR